MRSLVAALSAAVEALPPSYAPGPRRAARPGRRAPPAARRRCGRCRPGRPAPRARRARPGRRGPGRRTSPASTPSSRSCTEYATSSAQSMTCDSRQRRSPSTPSRSQREDRQVVVVHAVLGAARRARPGVLGGGVERGPGQVEPGPRHLDLEPGEHAQRLRVALEARRRAAPPRRAPARRCGRTAGARGRGPGRRRRPGPGRSPAPPRARGRPARTPASASAGCAARPATGVTGSTTCVLPASRRSAPECSTRARSRWKADRPGRSGAPTRRARSASSYVTRAP